MMNPDSIIARILDEVSGATSAEVNAYLVGASHDGTLNRLHRTLRIAQADKRWLDILRNLFRTLGKRSWIYRKGIRNVWVIKSTCRLRNDAFLEESETAALVRGYFDAEGGVPTSPYARFYIQFVQKNREDLLTLHKALLMLGIQSLRRLAHATTQQRWLENLFERSQISRARPVPDLMETQSCRRERAQNRTEKHK